MKKIFLDTEFTGLHQHASLLSLALVAESGEEFYAEFSDYPPQEINEWVAREVLTNFFLDNTNQDWQNLSRMQVKGTKEEITGALRVWLAQFGNEKSSLQVWADCPHYDWVFFCQLFGGALNIPNTIHYMCMDLATLFELRTGDSDRNREEFAAAGKAQLKGKKHNALYDAHVSRLCYNKLMNYDTV